MSGVGGRVTVILSGEANGVKVAELSFLLSAAPCLASA